MSYLLRRRNARAASYVPTGAYPSLDAALERVREELRGKGCAAALPFVAADCCIEDSSGKVCWEARGGMPRMRGM